MVSDDPETFADLDGHCPGGGAPGCVLQVREVAIRFASDPIGFAKSFVTGAYKQLTQNASTNWGFTPSRSSAPANDVERAGGAAFNGGVTAAAVLLPVVTGGEEPGETFMGPKEGSSGGPGAGKDFTPSTKQNVVDENAAANGGTAKCVYCGTKVTNEPGPDKVNIDHAQAKANGGNNTQPNGQVTCAYCNQSKGTAPAPRTPKVKPQEQNQNHQ